MKKYTKPQIKENKFETVDIITTSNVLDGLTNLDKSSNVDWGDNILNILDIF